MTHPVMHGMRALRAVAGREIRKFFHQPGRLFSSLVRPLLWFLVFAAGFQNVFGVPSSRHTRPILSTRSTWRPG